jgi:hypothetical protein
MGFASTFIHQHSYINIHTSTFIHQHSYINIHTSTFIQFIITGWQSLEDFDHVPVTLDSPWQTANGSRGLQVGEPDNDQREMIFLA